MDINWNEIPESPYGKGYEVVWLVTHATGKGDWFTHVPEDKEYTGIRDDNLFWPIDGNTGEEWDDDNYYKVFHAPETVGEKYAITSSEYTLFKDEAVFYEKYPLPKRGMYRPQPNPVPCKFPCLIKEIETIYMDNGPDEIIISVEYEFTKIGNIYP